MAKRELSDEEIRGLLKSVDSIQNELDIMKVKLKTIIGETTVLIPPEWERKRLKIWAMLHAKGDVVEYEEWHGHKLDRKLLDLIRKA